ncbi:condensin-2 complex subunit H2 [Dermacentor silvarum]|uniref:condensin-2 complex subunit H2 n=1 Tax=Dermacentor silvarum TaxID=543639 RepID=UPI0021016E52|nr:condensin-2 complex subunit H2 [Dermacentor silvarum]
MDGLGGSSQRHRAQDREIEQRYANLLSPIRDLTKNFEVDIAAYLDQYLGELSQTPITYQEGESSVNFTQAAFLIQGSAFVYGKKVEYLHSLVQKMAGEIVHNSLKGDTQENAKEGGSSSARRKKDDTQFMMHEDMEVADSLDDLTTPRQAARNQAAAQRNQFRRQRRRPLAMVVFDTEKETKLYDLKDDVVGYQVDYRLYTGVHEMAESQDEQQQENGRDADPSALLSMSPMGSTLDMADDCGPASPLSVIEDAEMVPFCGDIGAFEECPAKPDVEETSTVPVPPVRQSNLAKRIKEERIKHEVALQQHPAQPFIVIKRLHDPVEEVLGKDKPLMIRRKRKRALDDSSDSVSTVIVPVATIWVKQSHYPHLLTKELQLRKQGEVLPGGERCLRQTLEVPEADEQREGPECCQWNKDGFEDTAEDVDGVDDMPCDDLPGAEDEEKDFDLACSANIMLPDVAEPGPPPSDESTEKDSYEQLVHTYLQEFHEPLSECQLSDLQKRVADWESRIRPMLDIEEERESFNIRTYCNRVLDHFSDTPSKQTLYFRQICRGRQVWEVSRYFASTLQLANNYNVELNTDGVMEKGMDTLQLTLLSRKQHFHELEEFGDNHVSLTNSSEPARKGKQANNYNVELNTDGVMEKGMDTLQLTLLSRKQHFHELEEFGDNHVSLTNSSEPARKGKQARKRPPAVSYPEDPSDVLRENPVVPDPDFCADPRLPRTVRTTVRAKSRMRALAAVASLAEDSSEGENDENMATAFV